MLLLNSQTSFKTNFKAVDTLQSSENFRITADKMPGKAYKYNTKEKG